ncbi:hypothetical protein PEBR_40468 [Penicillium brasilianum]|uniref:Uncharacterized protein n=1 Tax=Penicillium brasilianum TaxID=104259 RepID=A0A1S9RBI7_PENBI|nr:hypothetical protein PEBR_40468 [Penicillium brasilianum]
MVKYDIATRTTAIMMSVFGVEPRYISDWTGIPTETVKIIYKRAVERGFDPSKRPFTLIDAYVADASRSGRPRKHTPELETTVLAKVRRDRYGREKTCAEIASELLNILATTTLEDFKNVIWTNETSVILLYRREGYRIWRTKDEAFLRSYIRERWKGSSEFMFKALWQAGGAIPQQASTVPSTEVRCPQVVGGFLRQDGQQWLESVYHGLDPSNYRSALTIDCGQDVEGTRSCELVFRSSQPASDRQAESPEHRPRTARSLQLNSSTIHHPPQ